MSIAGDGRGTSRDGNRERRLRRFVVTRVDLAFTLRNTTAAIGDRSVGP